MLYPFAGCSEARIRLDCGANAPQDRTHPPEQANRPAASGCARSGWTCRRRSARARRRPPRRSTHLGYVQIDTINVIERCHHHILYSRIPAYRRADLKQAQSVDKSVFEYWTHALSYVPAKDFRFFVPVDEASTSARATAGSPRSRPPTRAR